jgi:hypothetical protein
MTAVAGSLVAGCAPPSDNPTANPSGSTPPASSSVPADAERLLARYGLAGMTAVEIIDHLDRLAVTERPADLRASVRPDKLVISAGAEEFTLDLPADRFYLSVAPYLDRTHECFYHSLTTCKGELAARDVVITVVAETSGKVLVDETRASFDNGFVGLWLPRDIEGTLRISYGGKAGETTIATGGKAPTCLTTLRLA